VSPGPGSGKKEGPTMFARTIHAIARDREPKHPTPNVFRPMDARSLPDDRVRQEAAQGRRTMTHASNRGITGHGVVLAEEVGRCAAYIGGNSSGGKHPNLAPPRRDRWVIDFTNGRDGEATRTRT